MSSSRSTGFRRPAGFEVLREVPQHTNNNLHTVAEALIGWALGQSLLEPVGQELGEAMQRHSDQEGAPDQPQ
ncbi:hypothetical protein [Streptomyces sp. NBC_01334]|uniref:hypothetical protein n=1 Tax=Streptomyces sp. NBC_01334 TaxID=2903827 RepID=UPI002E138BFD|nr:hypothetical protein OG736_01020 [Streptomyces sp. NBC_01334]